MVTTVPSFLSNAAKDIPGALMGITGAMSTGEPGGSPVASHSFHPPASPPPKQAWSEVSTASSSSRSCLQLPRNPNLLTNRFLVPRLSLLLSRTPGNWLTRTFRQLVLHVSWGTCCGSPFPLSYMGYCCNAHNQLAGKLLSSLIWKSMGALGELTVRFPRRYIRNLP